MQVPGRRPSCRRVVYREQQTGSAQTRPALGVQVSPRRPAFARIPHCAHRATARHATFGMPTGQANRVSLLTSACLRASGASPRHSAIFRARSSKRTARLISGIALDECLDPERYRTRAPAFVPSAGRDYGSAGQFGNVNRASRPGLGANECVPPWDVVQVHGIPPFSARVVQREPSAL